MTKVGGRYYLQYGAPGTEFNAYANGTYVGDKPLGPFEYAAYNPVAYKPGGFVTGAGHGSTFQEATATGGTPARPGSATTGLRAADRHVPGQVRRRRADGTPRPASATSRNTSRRSKVEDTDSLFTGWMLLSYRKPASASSTMGEFAADGSPTKTRGPSGSPRAKRPGETLTVDLGRAKTVARGAGQLRRLQVGPLRRRPESTPSSPPAVARRPELAASRPNRGPRRDRPNAYIELPRPVHARFIRYDHGHVGARQSRDQRCARVRQCRRQAPVVPARVAAASSGSARCDDPLGEGAGAVGYNIRFGIRPDRLTLTHQLWADELGDGATLKKELRSLNSGVPYWVAVEAFNETGVSKLSRVVPVR